MTAAFLPVRNGARVFLILFLGLLAAACVNVRLVSDYDEQIDRGLTELYAETSAFVDRMIGARGRPEGTYAENQPFYSEALGRMDALIARAEANQVLNNCPSTSVMARILSSAGLPDDMRSRLGTLPEGSCQVAVLRLLRGAFGDLRALHQAQGERGIPESARGPILEGGLGSLFRTAIMIEVAKRGNQASGGR